MYFSIFPIEDFSSENLPSQIPSHLPLLLHSTSKQRTLCIPSVIFLIFFSKSNNESIHSYEATDGYVDVLDAGGDKRIDGLNNSGRVGDLRMNALRIALQLEPRRAAEVKNLLQKARSLQERLSMTSLPRYFITEKASVNLSKWP